MKRLLATAAASLLLSAMTAFGIAGAAQAAVYPPSDSIVVSSTTVEPGGSIVVRIKDGTFGSGEQLTVTTTGERGTDVSYALVRFDSTTSTYRDARANAAGGAGPITVTFPSGASGVYTIAVFSPSSPGVTATITVGTLPVTGFNASSTVGLWVGGGALVLAGAVVAIAVAVRRVQATRSE
ncbi:cell wall protein [Microbacterium sp. X-17]|uniref:cell wall protein n=1 Tax=Microbacterium sp. X-17 TaxID=3144404 RepID=UPI0031F575EE